MGMTGRVVHRASDYLRRHQVLIQSDPVYQYCQHAIDEAHHRPV